MSHRNRRHTVECPIVFSEYAKCAPCTIKAQMQDLLDFSDKARPHQHQFLQQMCEIPTGAELKCVLMSQTNE